MEKAKKEELNKEAQRLKMDAQARAEADRKRIAELEAAMKKDQEAAIAAQLAAEAAATAAEEARKKQKEKSAKERERLRAEVESNPPLLQHHSHLKFKACYFESSF